jgi:hypothetical protein
VSVFAREMWVSRDSVLGDKGGTFSYKAQVQSSD